MNRTSRQQPGQVLFMLVSLGLATIVAVQEVWADTTGNLVPVGNGGAADSNKWRNTAGALCVVNGVNCYPDVDDTPGVPDGDATYVRKSEAGNLRDISFNLDLSSIPNNSTITRVDITFVCRGEGVTVTMRSEYFVDGLQTLAGADVTCPLAYATFTQSYTGLSITKLATTDFEIGVRNTQNNIVRLTAIYAVITYTPASATTTTLGNGAAEPSSVTIPPGNAAVMIDAFSLVTNAGTETVTAITVSLAGAPAGALSLIEITNTAGTTVYGSVSNPSTGSVSISLTTNITATTTSTEYRIRITPSTHANMPAPPGATYTVTATVSSWTGSATHAGSDSGSATITIDNLSTADVTDATGTSGNSSGTIIPPPGEVSLFWVNPSDPDFHSVVVLRNVGAAVAVTPAEGVTYFKNDVITVGPNSATVVCVVTGSPLAESGCDDTGLINDGITKYYYKIFTRDIYLNYSTPGVVPTDPSTPLPNPYFTPVLKRIDWREVYQ